MDSCTDRHCSCFCTRTAKVTALSAGHLPSIVCFSTMRSRSLLSYVEVSALIAPACLTDCALPDGAPCQHCPHVNFQVKCAPRRHTRLFRVDGESLSSQLVQVDSFVCHQQLPWPLHTPALPPAESTQCLASCGTKLNRITLLGSCCSYSHHIQDIPCLGRTVVLHGGRQQPPCTYATFFTHGSMSAERMSRG